MSVAQAKNAIAQSLDKINTVTVEYSGTARGAPRPSKPASGILIYRDGSLAVGSINGDFSIVLEGGNSAWIGALSGEWTSPGTSPAQYTIMYAITDFIQKTNPNIYLDIQV